jgi:hypothetical protein
MGAYYKAVIKDQAAGEYEAIDPRNFEAGFKLMEHGFFETDYTKFIEAILYGNPTKLIWLCDYHEPDELTKHTWDTVKEIVRSNNVDIIYPFMNNEYIIINHSKKLIIDVKELYEQMSKIDFKIHPLVILTNSERKSAGGGDYHKVDSRRATWCDDIISTNDLIHKYHDDYAEYTDVTSDCIFTED